MDSSRKQRIYDEEMTRQRARDDYRHFKEIDEKSSGIGLIIIVAALLLSGIIYLIGQDNFDELMGNKNRQYTKYKFTSRAEETNLASFDELANRFNLRIAINSHDISINQEDLMYTYQGTATIWPGGSVVKDNVQATYKGVVMYIKDTDKFVQNINAIYIQPSEYQRIESEIMNKLDKLYNDLHKLQDEKTTYEPRIKVINVDIGKKQEEIDLLQSYLDSIHNWVQY